MQDKIRKPPFWYWILSLPMVTLGIMGILQVDSVWGEEMLEPLWTQVGYTIGIIGLFLGSLFLLLRKKIAYHFYVISACGFITHRFWLYFLSGTLDTLASYAPFTLLISILLDFLGVWVTKQGLKQKWIK